MMRSGVRRLRLMATVTLAVFMFWLWRRNTAMMDVYRKYGSAASVIGGGSVLRPDLQRPGMHEDNSAVPPASPAPDLTPPIVDDKHVDPKDAPAQSFDDLLHSEAGLADQEVTTSSSAAATPEVTTAPALPILPSVLDEEEKKDGTGYGRVEIPVDPSSTPTTTLHWSKHPQLFPISSTMQLPTGTSKPFPRIQRAINKLSMIGADEEKLSVIKEAMEHSWKNYRLFAFQHDEIRPVSHVPNDPFNGWGATLVDSLDTLWVMGMEKEFEEAVQAVGQIDFTTSARREIPLFETVIRYLGGMLAAYDVSDKKYRILLDKAVELGEVLYAAFDTPNRVPITYYRWQPDHASLPHRAASRVVLAEVGTLSLEFTRLAQLTGEPKYYDAIARLTDQLEEWQNDTRLPGMWPTSFDASGCGRPAVPDSTKTTIQQPVLDNPKPEVAAGPDVVSDDLKRLGQPGPLADDGVGKHEAEDELFNKDSHGNTWKQKRQIEGLDDDDEVLDVDEDDEEAEDDEEVVDEDEDEEDDEEDDSPDGVEDETDTEKAAAQEHKQRLPPPVRDDSAYCAPQGFASTSKNGMETFTLSGASDSMYEYLTKEYLLLGGQVDKYRQMYLDSAQVAIEKLVYKPMTPDERDILMTGELKISPNYSRPLEERAYIERFTPEVAHLACFTGGMFAMGGVIFDKPEHVDIASKLTDGCVYMYNITASGIMPEGAVVVGCENTWGDCPWNETAYWRALDPYADSRPAEPVSDASTNLGVDLPAPHDLPGPQYASATDTDRDDLNAQSVPSGTEASSQRTGPENTPNDLLNNHDEARGLPNPMAKRQLEALAEDAKRPAPPTPAGGSAQNTPPPAITHKEFVNRKIENERLPTGFVNFLQRKYILRPEAIESVFYMYRITGDPHWREVGWDMFTAIERATRAEFGFSAIHDVTRETPEHSDTMESFWMAETLKYFYLLYDDPNEWSLDEWVLNTEAHLFRRPSFQFADV